MVSIQVMFILKESIVGNQFLGKVRPIHEGAYNADVANKLLDIVLHEGALYVCIAPSSIDTPIEDRRFFKLVIPRGLPGATTSHTWNGTTLMSGDVEADLRGPAGPKGTPGAVGPAGPNGAKGPGGSGGSTRPPDHQWELSRGFSNGRAWKIANLRLGNKDTDTWGPWLNVAGASGSPEDSE